MARGQEQHNRPRDERAVLEAELAEIERLILLNEANENTIERTRKREELLELQDMLLDDIESL